MDIVQFIIGFVILVTGIAILVIPEFAYIIAIILVVIGIVTLLDAIYRKKKS